MVQFFLSEDIWRHIYEFDPEKREKHNRVLQEMRQVLYLFQRFVVDADPVRFARTHKKEEVQALCRYLGIKRGERATKFEMATMIASFVFAVIPGSFVEEEEEGEGSSV